MLNPSTFTESELDLLWARCDWDAKVFPFKGNGNQNRDGSFINVYVKNVFEV